jgi:hypothetical protein
VARKCVKWPLDKFIQENKDSLNNLKLINVDLFIDEKSSKEIVEFLRSAENKKRFRMILIHILQNQYNDLIYRREQISKKAKDITAMKFSGRNSRIYCKEFFLGLNSGGKKIVMIHLLDNKDFQRGSNKKIKDKIETIAQYEYDFGK